MFTPSSIYINGIGANLVAIGLVLSLVCVLGIIITLSLPSYARTNPTPTTC